jgi:hypothetical protein
MIGRFPDYDELYWNSPAMADFPDRPSVATITLPSPARFGQRAAYTARRDRPSALRA